MRNTIKAFALMGILIAFMAGVGFGQTNTITSTTLSAAVTAAAHSITVASATGISVSPQTALYVDNELMDVTAVSGTTISVRRTGNPAGHASGAAVWIGRPNWFKHVDPQMGTCTLASLYSHPWINVTNGNRFNCASSVWAIQNYISMDTTTSANVGAAATGVTAVEYGNGRNHVTKLTFSSLAIGSVTNTNLALGKLLYTFPSGVINVRAAYMSVGLAGSGSGCDADTPDGGIGTTIGSGAVAVLGGTAAFENMLTGQTFNDVNSTAEVITLATSLVIAAAGDHTVYFNIADGWAASADITATGTITIVWDYVGS